MFSFGLGLTKNPTILGVSPSLPSNADSQVLERVRVIGEDVLKDLGKEVREVLVKSYLHSDDDSESSVDSADDPLGLADDPLGLEMLEFVRSLPNFRT